MRSRLIATGKRLLAFLTRHLLPGGIRGRTLFIALIPSLSTAILLTLYFERQEMEQAEQEALSHLHNAARIMAAASQYPMMSKDRRLLDQVLAQMQQAEKLDYVQACDIRDAALARCGQASGKAPDSLPKPGHTVSLNGMWFASHPVMLPGRSPARDGLEDAGREASGGRTVGYVIAGLSTAPVRAWQRQVLFSAAALIAGVIALTTLIAWRLSSRLTQQIKEASQAMAHIASGELTVRVNESSSAEMGRLESGINRLAEALAASHANMEARIAEATANLAAKKEEAERANIAKSRFFAAASHDLRQPLHALTLFVGALKENTRYPEMRPLVDHIDASVSAMEMLFNSLLDISRLDAGVLEVHREDFPASRLFDRVRQQYEEVAREKGLRFTVRPCRLALYSDPVLVERILLNLVSNAIRYTHDGGVLVSGRKRGGHLLIQVFDTGLGIPDASQEAVFQEFVQLNNPARDRRKGLGLGLAIVSRLARLLDQRIRIRSVVGQGSVFSVEVPLASSQAASLPAAQPLRTSMPQHGTLAVLIDDEEAILRAMEELFDAWKIDLVTARNVEEAVDWLRSMERRPDILLTDFRLPDNTNGIEVVNYLRMCFGDHLPALILTGDTAPETLHRINEAGLAMLHKPIRPARLRSLIMHLLERQQPSGS